MQTTLYDLLVIYAGQIVIVCCKLQEVEYIACCLKLHVKL